MDSQGKVETLLKINPGSKVEIRFESLNRILNKVGHRPVSIYSINGQTRTGKSFTLNCILKFLHFNRTNPENWIEQNLAHAFEWNGDAERVTSGIEIWSEPIFVNCDGQEIAVLLLDTQGLFDGVTPMQDNHAIFAFSALLSSYMIYNNWEKEMNEKTWQFLNFLINFANLDTQQASSLENQESSPSLALNLLIRDWSNKQDFSFGHYSKQSCPSDAGGNIYNNYFSLEGNHGEESTRCRISLLKNFRSISIDLMPYPGDELVHQDNYNASSWDSRFLNHLKEYIANHFSNTAILSNKKCIGGEVVTGNEMVETVQKWAKMFENTNQLEPRSIYETTAKLQHAQAVSKLSEEYSRRFIEMLNKTPDGIQNFDQASESVKNELLSKFQSSKLLGHQEYSQEFSLKLKEKFDAEEVQFKASNNGKLQNAAYRKEQARIEQEKEITRQAHEREIKRLQEEANERKRQFEIEQEDRQTETQMNSGFLARGQAISVQVVRVNGQRMYDYTLGTGTFSLGSLSQPVRNLYLNGGNVTLT